MCTCGCSSSDDSDSVDTVVFNKNYRTYMCKSACSSGSDSDVTDVNNSMLQYKLYQFFILRLLVHSLMFISSPYAPICKIIIYGWYTINQNRMVVMF